MASILNDQLVLGYVVNKFWTLINKKNEIFNLFESSKPDPSQ